MYFPNSCVRGLGNQKPMSENPTDSDDRDAPSPTDDDLAEREPDRDVITVSRGPGDRDDDQDGDELPESAKRVAAAWDDSEGER
jgi:hypothetical protein